MLLSANFAPKYLAKLLAASNKIKYICWDISLIDLATIVSFLVHCEPEPLQHVKWCAQCTDISCKASLNVLCVT